MGSLEGRVAIVTGAGRGIGREHALYFAQQGAKVVVNDVGGAPDGRGGDPTAAQVVVDEIQALGGEAVADGDDVADWKGGQELINTALDVYGDLHVLVNNAGILRDSTVINMTEEDWDSVVTVHMKGHFVPTKFAAAYWRAQFKSGVEVPRCVIHTSSTSGLLANPGQTNYGSAKSAIATFSQICAKELARYGVRSNCVAPAARTRLTESTPGLGDIMQPPAEDSQFDVWDPANISPLVAYLSTAECPFTGATFSVQGGTIKLF
ncbi:MAG: putative oxidoreductase, partial [Acidimicrobiia bacterium]|nr:putative oxidoreductase [Acidimicrobiia bacterium]